MPRASNEPPRSASAPTVRPVSLELGGVRLRLRTDADDATLEELVAALTRRIRDVEGAAVGASGQQVALLAALRLCDELAREQVRAARLRLEVRRRSTALLEKLRQLEAKLGTAEPEPRPAKGGRRSARARRVGSSRAEGARSGARTPTEGRSR